MRFTTIALAIVCPLVGAIQFTNPAPDSTLTLAKGSSFDVSWDPVDTDPEVLSIYLWNFVNFPPYSQSLALDIQTSLKAYTVTIPCSADSASGFQFAAINGTDTTDIYALSAQFTIEDGAC